MSEWTDIGEQLRKARESKDLELQAVAHSTRIPLATLEALEESDYSIFPSPTYARSFLSQYSEFLGVDAHDWIEAFETGDVLSNVNDHGYLQDQHDHVGSSERQVSTREKKQSNRSSNEKASRGGTSILQTLTVFLVTALLIGGGIYAYLKYEHMLTGITEEEVTDPEETDVETPPEPASPPPSSKTTENPTEVAATNTQPPKATEVNTGSPLPPGVTPSTKPEEADPEPNKPRTGPPPKALVIEEEE
ncbi:MAG: helix-turn-helix domain-containing protein [Akkermansiaceae bacterium]